MPPVNHPSRALLSRRCFEEPDMPDRLVAIFTAAGWVAVAILLVLT